MHFIVSILVPQVYEGSRVLLGLACDLEQFVHLLLALDL